MHDTSSNRLADYTRDAVTHAQSLDFVRWLSALADADGLPHTAAKIFHERWPRAIYRDLITKAVVAAGTTADANWAAPLARVPTLMDAFLSYARPATLLGRIPGLRHVPLNVAVATQTGGGSFRWVGQGLSKPATSFAFTRTIVDPLKCAGIVPVTAELLRLAAPGSEVELRAELISGLQALVDATFIDPAVAEVVGESPASITYGVTPIASSGSSEANARTDFKALRSAFVAANPNAEAAVLICNPNNGSALALALNAPGWTEGSAFGIRLFTSTALGSTLVMLDPSAILVADGGVDLDVSRHATLDLNDSGAAPDAATVQVSLWQNNLVGLRAERFINWKVGRLNSVKMVNGAAYA